ncbi:MAG: M3 family oligoendopeptidase [Chloroflexota bacterium]
MLTTLPATTEALFDWTWAEIEPYYEELKSRGLTAASVDEWVKDWSDLGRHVYDLYARLQVATTVNTADEAAEKRFTNFLDTIYPNSEAAENALKQKLLDSGLEPGNFTVALRNLRAEADLFRDENVPLMAEEQKLGLEYDKIMGAQTVMWEGEEKTISQMYPVLLEKDRQRREKAFRLILERRYQDHEKIGEVWSKLMGLRKQIAANAGKPDYRAFCWQQKLRFDYTPDDAKQFLRAIEEAVVPAAARVRERRRQRLGIDTVRPWDTEVDTLGDEPIRPFKTMDELNRGTRAIFDRVDPDLGRHYQVMVEEKLLDLDNRKNKAPGGYCTAFEVTHRPFIFMNSVGTHDDVQTLLHEGGHSFHVFATAGIELRQNLNTPMEFNEVASMAMELLAAPHLLDSGMYTEAEAARAQIQHLESNLVFWPYMAVVDAFQHWIYENHDAATDPVRCGEKWSELYDRYMAGLDWSGLEQFKAIHWMRQLHIIQAPFYYIEYGLAQLGAAQVWANSLSDYAGAVKAYRKALSLGGTVTLPELFSAAGARFAFDASTLKRSVDLMEQKIEELEARL